MLALWIGTAFLGSGLLFVVEPMLVRMLLPRLGGAPAVWTTSVLFFQAALLAGYAYAHQAGRLAPRAQVALHTGLLLLAFGLLPFRLVEGAPGSVAPTLWLLRALAVAIGIPFLVLAAGAPLLQRWLRFTALPAAGDPYVLYSASSAGSLIALAAYPVLIEPVLGLETQTRLWAWGYALYLLLVLCCAASARRGWGRALGGGSGAVQDPEREGAGPPSLGRRLHWLALAAVPSSLMHGVTAFITADVAAVPFLWILPLALYLLTFVVAFARRDRLPAARTARLLPVAAVVFMLIWMTRASEPVAVVATGHLAAFFVAALICHGELYRLRPDPRHLTTYYLLVGFGGVVGGAINTLIAPALFSDVIEYPAAFVLACLLAPEARLTASGGANQRRRRLAKALGGARRRRAAGLREVVIPVVLGLTTLALLGLTGDWRPGPARLALTAGLPVFLTYLASESRPRFGLAVAAVLWAGSLDTSLRGPSQLTRRTFFGVYRVTRTAAARDGRAEAWNELYHGTTIHGVQKVEAATGVPAGPREPLAYYAPASPIGRLFGSYGGGVRPERVGLVGLGAGSLLAYAEPGQHWTAFEIDPLVAQIAADEAYFSYLPEARRRGVSVGVLLGDARVTLAATAEEPFDLLVLDAFTGGAVPVHLLTREAFRLYLERLGRDGILALHVSNRHFDVGRLTLAMAADLNLAGVVQDDLSPPSRPGERLGSRWAFLARSLEALRARGLGVTRARAPLGRQRVWTDDYADLWSLFEW